jgi:hypothetical protein
VSSWSAYSSCSRSCGLPDAAFSSLGGQPLAIDISARDRGSVWYYDGRITRANGDGTYRVLFSSGLEDPEVPLSNINAPDVNFGPMQNHTRAVTTPAACGGTACPTLFTAMPCNRFACPVDCRQSEWTAWSSCHATCSTGLKTRLRTVLAYPASGGQSCGLNRQHLPCDTGIPCPTDCAVSHWTPYSSCSKSCASGDGDGAVTFEEAGARTRTREVLSDTSLYGSANCPALTQTVACSEARCPRDCIQTEWTPWSACSATCGDTGDQWRMRGIHTPAAHGGKECTFAPNEFNTHLERRPCEVLPPACPKSCEVTAWSAFRPCTASCKPSAHLQAEHGLVDPVQWRNRTVLVPASDGGMACPVLGESRVCSLLHVCPQDCLVGSWGDWGPPPGAWTGHLQRTRVVRHPAVGGGIACPPLTDEKVYDCTRDADEIGGWSTCSKQCNGGIMKRLKKHKICSKESAIKYYVSFVQVQACQQQDCLAGQPEGAVEVTAPTMDFHPVVSLRYAAP